MIKLSKTSDEYFQNSGWSSKLFLSHAILIYEYFKDQMKIGRTVVYIGKYKLYVHYKGKSKEYMSLCDSKGNELHTFHYSEDTKLVLDKIKEVMNDSKILL